MAEQSYGLTRMIPVSELQEIEKKQFELEDLTPETENGLAAHISTAWETNRDAKEKVELELLACLRQRNGEYEPDTLAEIKETGGSEIYMMITATKIRAAISWIRDILMPSGDKAWGLSPTPIPELPEWAMAAIAQRIADTLPQMEPEQGYEAYMQERAGRMRDDAIDAMRDIAKQAAERMEDKIDDQMTEGNWVEAFSEFIDDFCTFPYAVLKGPVFIRRNKLSWGPGGQPKVDSVVQMEWARVSPFDAYPSPEASSPQDGDFIERIRYTRAKLQGLIGVPGYDEQSIRDVLEDYGRNGLRDWIWRDHERAKLEGKDYEWMRSASHLIDGLHFWGSVQGLILLEWGMDPEDIPDPLMEYNIDAIKIGRHVIRAVINKDPLSRRPYHKACFDPIPGGFAGNSIAYRMRDIQNMCNASARAISNDLSLTSGPQVAVNIDRLPEGEEVGGMTPFRVWQFKKDENGYNKDPIEFFQPKSNVDKLFRVYEEFERRADDVTAIPRYAYGNENVGGAGQTMGGLSMLMDNASKGIKLAISNIDLYAVKPTLEISFTHNMIFDPDPTIKGDASIVARGSNALLMKETAKLRRNEFLSITNNEVDMSIMGVEGRATLLHEAAKDLVDVTANDIVPDREEFMAKQEEMRKQAEENPPPPDPEILKIQQQGEQARAKLEQENQHFIQKLQKEGEWEAEKQNNELKMHREKLEADIDMNIRNDALTRKEAKKQADTVEKSKKEAADSDIAKIITEVRASIDELKKVEPKEEKKEKEEKEPQPVVVNLTIDNKSGAVKKTIEVNRGKDNLIKSADVTEKPVEE